MPITEDKLDLSAPDLDLDRLSAGPAKPEALRAWAAELPMANTQECARQLHRAITELSRLQASLQQRLSCLEALRPRVQFLCARLDKAAAGSSHLGDGPAAAAQQLQMDLALAYRSCVRQALAESSTDSRKALGLAVHRSMSDLSQALLRAYQHYTNLATGTWRQLHQLYQLAEDEHITDHAYADEDGQALLSIGQVYLRMLLLAGAHPNRLRQRHLTQIYTALEHWVQFAALLPAHQDSLLVVDLGQDAPPRHRRLAPADGPAIRAIRSETLASALDDALQGQPSRARIDGLQPDLLQHLVHAWSLIRKRAFQRLPGNGTMKICVGMRAVHYYMSGGVEFADLVGSADALLRRELNPFLDTSRKVDPRAPVVNDPWAQAFDAGPMRMPENPNIEDPQLLLLQKRKDDGRRKAEAASTYLCQDVLVEDNSPAGFGLRWQGPFPPQLLAGELLAIRERDDDRWCIADCRWLRHDGNQSRLGIELLSPKAIAVAVRRLDKHGGQREYSRALLLPALDAIKQPPMLILPQVGFAEQHKVHIRHQGKQKTAQLTRMVRMTESYTQFTFRMLDGYLENRPENRSMNHLWDSISYTSPKR